MSSLLQRVDGAREVLDVLHFSLNFIKVVTEVHPRPHRVIGLLQGVHLSEYFIEVMIPLHPVDWILQTFQISKMFVNLREVVGMILTVNRALEGLEIGQILLDFCVSVASVNVVHRVVEAPQIVQSCLYLSEMVLALNIVDWASQLLQCRHSFLDLSKVVLTFHVVFGAVQSFHLGNLRLHLGEFVFSLNIINRSREILQSLHSGLYFTEMMTEVHLTTDWVMHFLQGMKLSVDLGEFVISVDGENRILQGLEFYKRLLDPFILVFSVN